MHQLKPRCNASTGVGRVQRRAVDELRGRPVGDAKGYEVGSRWVALGAKAVDQAGGAHAYEEGRDGPDAEADLRAATQGLP
jgi:hypothetical protein